MKNLLCAVALFSTTTKFSSVPVAHAMGRYEPDMCKVQIFEITSSSSAEIDEEDPDETRFEPRDADADYVAGEEEVALLNFDLPQGCVANLAQLELFTTSTTGDEASYVTAHKMIEGWGETSTWNSMTPLQFEPAASFTITRSFLSADVTEDVNGWLAEPSTQNGWAFKNTGPDSYKFLTYVGAAEEAGKQYCEDSGFTEEQCMANDRNNDASSTCWCAWSDNEDAGRDECIWAGRFIEGGPQYAGCGAADGVIGRGPKLLLVAHDCPSTATPLATRTFSSPGCATESFEITSSVATELSPSGVLRDQLSSVAAHHPEFTHARFPRRHSGEPDTAHGDQEDIDVGVNEAITCAGQTSCYYGGSPCAADEFCNFDDGSSGFCEQCSSFSDSVACYNDGLPSAGAADCEACCFGDQPSGTSQGLLKFDLGAIDGCDVIHAQLELHTISDTVGDAAKAYRLNGAAAWDASTTTWTSLPGPGGAMPSQYAADPSFTTDPYSGAFLSTDVTEDVAAWLANPADNRGWAFISDDSHIWGFVTSMGDKPAEHPRLVVVAANCP